MATTANSITYSVVTTTVVSLPRTVTADTDPQTVDYAMRAYYDRAHDEMQHSGGCFPFATLTTIAGIMTEGSAFCCTYTNERGETRARTIFPTAIHLTEARKIEVTGWDSYRRLTRSFRLDRCEGVHLVTAPGDTDHAPATPAPDFSTQEGAFAYMQAKEVVQAAREGRMPRAMND